jgi:hypothetical protein
MTKLRASNLRIPIETGRWYNIPKDWWWVPLIICLL